VCCVVDGLPVAEAPTAPWVSVLLRPPLQAPCPLARVTDLCAVWGGRDLLLVDRASGDLCADVPALLERLRVRTGAIAQAPVGWWARCVAASPGRRPFQ